MQPGVHAGRRDLVDRAPAAERRVIWPALSRRSIEGTIRALHEFPAGRTSVTFGVVSELVQNALSVRAVELRVESVDIAAIEACRSADAAGAVQGSVRPLNHPARRLRHVSNDRDRRRGLRAGSRCHHHPRESGEHENCETADKACVDCSHGFLRCGDIKSAACRAARRQSLAG